MPDPIEDDIDAIQNLPPFRTFACRKCGAAIRVHALETYANCPKCGLQHKTRAFGGIGTEVQDVIDAVLEWAGVSREEVKQRHEGKESTPAHQTSPMAPLTAKSVTCGEALIGFIEETGFDQPWTYGRFEPGPAYQQYAPLFDSERESNEAYARVAENAADDVHEAAHEAWMTALEVINQLGLRVGGTRVRDFKINSRSECEFKLGW
jgi:hypothetical protein